MSCQPPNATKTLAFSARIWINKCWLCTTSEWVDGWLVLILLKVVVERKQSTCICDFLWGFVSALRMQNLFAKLNDVPACCFQPSSSWQMQTHLNVKTGNSNSNSVYIYPGHRNRQSPSTFAGICDSPTDSSPAFESNSKLAYLVQQRQRSRGLFSGKAINV